jgi:hypothetical protein
MGEEISMENTLKANCQIISALEEAGEQKATGKISEITGK